MKVIYNLFRYALIINMVAFCIAMLFVLFSNPGESPGYFGRLIGAVWISTWIVLLVSSVVLLFGNRRKGLQGLLAVFAELFIMALFPQL